MDEIIDNILEFRDQREWSQFQTPSNLAKSISIEAAELLELFQWNDNEYELDDVKEELADVLIYSFLMAATLNLNIKEIMLDKIAKNEMKYPVSKCKGISTKYDKL